ncbi:retrotransposon protein, putative, unclassified [Tanacetum coccineum]
MQDSDDRFFRGNISSPKSNRSLSNFGKGRKKQDGANGKPVERLYKNANTWKGYKDRGRRYFRKCPNNDMIAQISLNALTGIHNFQTIRVKWVIRRQTVNILVDCGSTHNFVDLHMAKRIGCIMKPMYSLQVSVANGEVMTSTLMCQGLSMTIGEVTYMIGAMVLPLGACDMVLGIQWLATLGDIQFNFEKLTMVFYVGNQKVLLRGAPQPSLKWMQPKEQTNATLNLILPPKRSHDHHIPLMPNTPLVNIRPYRHPPSQKDAIEQIVKEFLKDVIIRSSHSSFSSPIVMVKKKYGSLRMCVDYSQLNKCTVKEKFQIPIIEDIINELHGSMVFSKLDIRYGYHQIRMWESKIHKIAFRTHDDHYEFLVMPFGLTNDPSTFQSLMNEIFKPYLIQFTLTMQAHTLFANRSKCTFAMSQVEYLRHIIFNKGVETDPTKIEAMKDWLVPTNVKKLRGFLENSFERSDIAQEAFAQPKEAMNQALVLGLPNFKREFTVEINACGTGIGAVMLQDGHPLAYLSKDLSPKHQALSTYEKEFLAVTLVLEKWKGYLMDRNFKIKTDHFSLKYLSGNEKKMSSICYWKGMRKMVKQWIRECGVCQRQKLDLSAYPGLLQPLPIPVKVWSEISIDFVEGLPKSHGKTVIFVVVDRLNKKVTARQSLYNKLSAEYYGPFKIVEKIGNVAYKLQLPSGSLFHILFHVLQLKLCKGVVDKPDTLPMCDNEGLSSVFPVKIIDRRLGKLNNRVVAYVLVQWSNGSEKEATWELYTDLLKKFPECGKSNSKENGLISAK